MKSFEPSFRSRSRSRKNQSRRNQEVCSVRRLPDDFGLTYERFEPRCLLSASGGLSPVQELGILKDISSRPETSYLQSGSNDLQLIAAETGAASTTALFQQTINGFAVKGAYITVVQQNGVTRDVYDRGNSALFIDTSTGASINVQSAEAIARQNVNARNPASVSSELVWYQFGNRAELAWQVSTFINAPQGDFPTADFVTYVDADSATVLSHETPFELVEYLLQNPAVEVGEFERIVINEAIGAAGSRAYAAPFDAVVEVAGGCTGTLIAANTVLTARHCGVGSGAQIVFGDNSNSPTFLATVQSAFNPAGGSSGSPLLNGGDVTILTLTGNVPTNIATPMRLIANTGSLVGQVIATIGYGYNGLGNTGHGFSADGFRWGGENILDVYGSPAGASGTNILSTDFDNGTSGANTISGSSPVPVTYEATTAPGDSGGPILVQVGSEWVIAGVLSGGTTSNSVYGDISWWTGIGIYQSAIEARGGVFVGSGAGSVSFDSQGYQLGDTFTVTVTDGNPAPPITVTVVSDSGDSETMVLTANGSTFTGNLMISGGAVSANDGTLQASVSDVITVTYVDPDDGTGNPQNHTDTANIFDMGSILVGIDFDLASGTNPSNWLEVTGGNNATFNNLSDEQGNPTEIDLTINETPNGSWSGYAASINAGTLPFHANSLAALDGQIYNGSDTFILTYSGLVPSANYEIYVFGLEGEFNSIQQRVTIAGAGSPVSFDQNFNKNDLFINRQIGDSSRALGEYAEVITADASGMIVITIDPIGSTSDVVLGGIAIAEIPDHDCGGEVTIPITPVNHGIAVTDDATGTGYIMYSEQSLFTRFGTSSSSSTPGVYPNNSAHLVAVRLNGSQWQYNTNFAWRNFTPAAHDRLLASVNFSTDTVTSLAGTDSTISGIVAGYISGDLVITPNMWNGVFNAGEFGVVGTQITHVAGTVNTNVTPVNRGIAVTDDATGTGYIMYSQESLFTRFGTSSSSSTPGVYPNNAAHLVAVRLNGSQWQYNTNFAWRNFTPAANDRLLADVNFSTDTVNSLEGTSSTVNGIQAGYVSGDLVLTPNMWDGVFNSGEFGAAGTFFAYNAGNAPTNVTPVNFGIAVTDDATGTGYIMYSQESLFTRFGTSTNSSNPGVFANNAAHLVAVRLNGSQWQYNTNFAWRNFTPAANDRLLADVNFSTDTVTSLEGTSSTVNGIPAGYVTGDLVFTPNVWNGVFNSGEFGVTGTFFDVCPANRSGDGGGGRFAANDGGNDQLKPGGRDGLAVGYGMPVMENRTSASWNIVELDDVPSKFDFGLKSGLDFPSRTALGFREGSGIGAIDGSLLGDLAESLQRESDLELGKDFDQFDFDFGFVQELETVHKANG